MLNIGKAEIWHGRGISDGGFGEWFVDGAEEIGVINRDLHRLAIPNDLLFPSMDLIQGRDGKTRPIKGVTSRANRRELGFGIAYGVLLGGNRLSHRVIGSPALMMNHGIPCGILVERELVDLHFNDPAHVLVAVVLLRHIGR